MSNANRDTAQPTMHITPEQLAEMLSIWDAAPPRTDDETFRLLDGTPVTEEEYFALVAEHRTQRSAQR